MRMIVGEGDRDEARFRSSNLTSESSVGEALHA